MHLHLTTPQLLIAAFAMGMGIIFAVAALLEQRAKKAPPFQNYFATEYDRNLFPAEASESDDFLNEWHRQTAPPSGYASSGDKESLERNSPL